MQHSNTISLECPYCQSRCQFIEENNDLQECKVDKLRHSSYLCTHCHGKVITRWKDTFNQIQWHSYTPLASRYKHRVDLNTITNEQVKKDFQEAISCYNNDLYNACMIMARRAIQQEMMTIKEANKKDSLYKQIESMGISKQLKNLLKKIKNFGNYGAHPDFCLFDEKEDIIEDEQSLSKLSLEFLDRYFSDTYEISVLVDNAPKSEKELQKSK